MAAQTANSSRKENPPNKTDLERALGGAYPLYLEVLSLAGDCTHEWKYYGKKYGWQLKVVRKGKALFYVSMLDNSFRLGLGLRENEKKALLDSDFPPDLLQQLSTAKKYPEGYPLRFEVKTKADMGPVRTTLSLLKEMRA